MHGSSMDRHHILPFLFRSITHEHVKQHKEFIRLSTALEAERVYIAEMESKNHRNGLLTIDLTLPAQTNTATWKGLSSIANGQLSEELSRFVPCIYGFHRLAHGVWLNDSIIDGYFDLIHRKGPQLGEDMSMKVYLGSSTFFARYPFVSNHDWFTAVVKSTSGKKLSSYRVSGDKSPHILHFKHILFPALVEGNHWVLVQISPGLRTVAIHDSLSGNPGHTVHSAEYKRLRQRIIVWANEQDKLLAELDGHAPGTRSPHLLDELPLTCWEFAPPLIDLPRQKNCDDCGVFVCMFARYIASGTPFDFDQTNMRNMRIAMLIELLSGSL